jgi:hypothetical protein
MVRAIRSTTMTVRGAVHAAIGVRIGLLGLSDGQVATRKITHVLPVLRVRHPLATVFVHLVVTVRLSVSVYIVPSHQFPMLRCRHPPLPHFTGGTLAGGEVWERQRVIELACEYGRYG